MDASPSDMDSLVGAAFTVTLHTAFLPLKVFTEMFAVPVPTAVTRPWGSTVATAGLLEAHLSADAVLLGRLARSVSASPAPRVAFDLFRVTLEGALRTLTSQVAVISPQLAVMTAVPAFLAVTLPLALPTEAKDGASDAKVTLPAVSGSAKVAARVKVSFTPSSRIAAFSAIGPCAASASSSWTWEASSSPSDAAASIASSMTSTASEASAASGSTVPMAAGSVVSGSTASIAAGSAASGSVTSTASGSSTGSSPA